MTPTSNYFQSITTASFKIKNTHSIKKIMKFDFNDINLKPRKSIVDSRSQCDTSLKLGKFQFQLPIIPANMQAIIDEDIAIKLSEGGYFYIMHRFDIDVVEFIKTMKSYNYPTSISIGVNNDSYELINQLVELDLIPDFITIDIAHGHSIKMEKMLQFLKEKLPQTFLIAGNISTPEGVEDLQNWGADALKCGIGPGCFISTSMVKTESGIKSLSEISIGDSVLTHENRFKKVLEKHNYTGEQDLIKINNLPPCTEKHEFYVIKKSDKDIVNEENLSKYAFWIEAYKLDKNIHLLVKM